VRRQDLEWWPVVNRDKPAFLQGAGYVDSRYRVFSSARAPTLSTRATTAVSGGSSAGLGSGWSSASPVAHVAATGECLIELFDQTEPSFVSDARNLGQFANSSGMPVFSTRTVEGLKRALGQASGQGCSDAVIYLGGHGSADPRDHVLEGGKPVDERTAPTLWSQWKVTVLDQFKVELTNRPIDAAALANALSAARSAAGAAGRQLGFKLIVQSCFSGRFINYAPLRDLTKFMGTSSGPNEFSTGTPDGSTYTKALVRAVEQIPPGGDVAGRLIQAAPGVPAGDKEHPRWWDGTNVQVAAVPPPVNAKCGGKYGYPTLDVSVLGTFTPDNAWGVGRVDGPRGPASPGVQSVSNGYDALAVGTMAFFCGQGFTLRATPAQGSEFAGWSSPEGLCKTDSPACILVAKNPGRAHLRATFRPKLYTVTVVNANKDAGAAIAAANFFPGINCGTRYNGPSRTVGTACSSPARASFGSVDYRSMSFYANNSDPDYGTPAYQVDKVDGCDTVVYNSGAAQCNLTLVADRTVTVTWKLRSP
jgi:hypothetical protein